MVEGFRLSGFMGNLLLNVKIQNLSKSKSEKLILNIFSIMYIFKFFLS
jgi:hypothetical protein